MALSSEARAALSADQFAVPSKRELPFPDAEHTRLAWDMVDDTDGLTPAERSEARSRILRKAKEFGVDTKGWAKKVSASIRFEAMALDMPEVSGHPNRMPFSGVLTRVGVPSDIAPHGSGGKRVMLTHAAAEAALPSLMGMGVDLTAKLDNHDAQNKIGVITAASIDGDALMIEGFVYAADFPKEALRIQRDQKKLGFSFEAQNISVESFDTDPVVITACCFTGAAILFADKAAYTTTSLAASADEKGFKMDEATQKAIAAIIGEAVTTAVKPLGDRLGTMEASMVDMNGRIEANAATRSKVDPLADKAEDLASKMEAAGIGLDARNGHVTHLRNMANSMRADAALGKMPSSYSGMPYYAAGDNRAVAGEGAAPSFTDSAEYKALQAQITTLSAAAATAKTDLEGKLAAVTTQLTDATTKLAAAAATAPERKTYPPAITALLAKGVIDLPADGGKFTPKQVNDALSKSGLDAGQRIQAKLALEREGLVAA